MSYFFTKNGTMGQSFSPSGTICFKTKDHNVMNLLAFDTSTQTLGLALLTDGQTLLLEMEGGARASEDLLPQIMRLLGNSDLNIKDLDAIVFGCGPGAFTGLRTSCSVAQGLAMGAGLPVIPVVTLHACAQQHWLTLPELQHNTDIFVQLDARMNEWYWAHYQWVNNKWTILEAPCLSSPQEMQIYVDKHHPKHTITMIAPPMVGMMTLAQAAWKQGKTVPPEEALPLYLRNKVALTTAERMALHNSKEKG